MKERIKLESRYKSVHTYYQPITDNEGVLMSDGEYIRGILSEDHKALKGIDFEGGPMLCVGNILEGTNKKIKSLKMCCYVELE